MKTRTGFVSNSSSSSFIVVFDKDPSDINNLTQEMGECESTYDPYYNYDEVPCKERVVERVHKDIMDTEPVSAEELMRELESSMYDEIQKLPGCPKMSDYKSRTNDDTWEKYWEAKNAFFDPIIANAFENFKKEHKGKFIYVLGYSDNDGPFDVAMENGEVFRNLPYSKRVSHH